MEAQQLDDDSPMSFGQYKGTKMGQLDAKYLLWLKDNIKWSSPNNAVLLYILDNLSILQKECSRATK